MRISQLDGKKIALWGWGREGQAAYRALRARFPHLPLVIFCTSQEMEKIAGLGDRGVVAETVVDIERLRRFDVIIKSPGISSYRSEIAMADETVFVGGTTLWFAEHPQARTLCVTGTKGKSTSTALLAHLLRSAGHRTALAGNIGLPLLELLSPLESPEFWAIELSSYQTRDVVRSGMRPEVALVLNLYPEHLDWHGDQAHYFSDKLALVTEGKPRIAVLNAQDARLQTLTLPASEVRWFNDVSGWHIRDGKLYRGGAMRAEMSRLQLPGVHNQINLCGVLTVIEALGLDAMEMLDAVETFLPLPHRLQRLGRRDGIDYVNDSISTTPHATLAALSSLAGDRVALLVGGYDRGLDWHAFADRLSEFPPAAIATMGANGARIHAVLKSVTTQIGIPMRACEDLAEATVFARQTLSGNGVVLLSPGAPSFDRYRDYAERGRHFATLCGFDADVAAAIPGLGIQ